MSKLETSELDTLVFGKPEALEERISHYCAGCGHGIVQRLIAEVIDELGIRERAICVSSVGCTVTSYHYFNFDGLESAHGRAPAVATAIKRCRPNLVPYTLQGDGDLASIGTAEIVHACARGENISVFFVNNATYGMTGGQMAPTTLLGQKTTTTPFGRRAEVEGYPIKVPELLASLSGSSYLERVAVDNPANVRKTKKAVKKAFLLQIEKEKFSLVEILSPCPTAWRLSPLDSLKVMEEKMFTFNPLRVIKEEKEKQQFTKILNRL